MVLATIDGIRPRPPELFVFADTRGEPEYVYDHLRRLTEYVNKNDGPPIVTVSKGDLAADTFTKRSVSFPLWIKKSDGKLGFGGRWCTDKYKTRAINQYLRGWAGVPRGQKTPMVRVNLGISTDEATRQKSSREPWMIFGHPLLTKRDDPDGLGWSRQDCLDYLESKGWGDTPKSACAYCAFHDDALWAEIKALAPADFERACLLDEAARNGTRSEDEGGKAYFLHRSLIPLRDVSLPDYIPGAASQSSVGCSPYGCARDGSQISLFDADEVA